ncbi:major facilitator superfamily domain-containing protein [Zychaea mexicana]|uniref:major facilitator superfamily domain-containing protein n=1 Tax=Zychaea mexicana TaxID=64656 RepID=UPI0022FE249E|nr:major facilitator superfamily domain-containing protein [Zychaea mexicana]KAI9492402.1 major facilitator superfamily domain-containing protein [Zychaea mexicana]
MFDKSFQAEEKSLVRKIHWVLLPQLMTIQFFQIHDRTTLNFGSVMGMLEDIKLSQAEFNWSGAIIFVGYLTCQIPNAFLLHKLPLSKYLGVLVIGWGVTLLLTAISRSFAQVFVLRFVLGFLEAPAYPIIFLIITIMYRRDEQATANTIFLLANGIVTVLGSIITFGMTYMHTFAGIRNWEWYYCIVARTVVFGVVVFIFLPDGPRSRWFRLTPAQDAIIDSRIQDNAVTVNKRVQRYQIMEAIREPRLYCYFFITLLTMMTNGCTILYNSKLIQDMGYSTKETVLLNIPQCIPDMIMTVVALFIRRRYNDSLCYIGAASCAIAMAGILTLTFGTSTGIKLLGLYLCNSLDPIIFALMTSMGNNVAGYTKKIVYNGGWMVAYCLGNFIAPLLMTHRQAPQYLGAMLTYAAGQGISIFLFLYARMIMAREMQRRKKLSIEGKLPPPPLDRDKLVMTDVENLHYVYML